MDGTGNSGDEDEDLSLLEDSSGELDRDRAGNLGGKPNTWVGAGGVGILGILAGFLGDDSALPYMDPA